MCFEKMVDFSNKSTTLDKIVYNKTEIKLDISLKFKLVKRYSTEEIMDHDFSTPHILSLGGRKIMRKYNIYIINI